MTSFNANGWRTDIENAPRDGSLLLLNVKRRFPSVIPARWREDTYSDNFWDGENWWGYDDEVTHWQPLPNPPVEQS